MLRLTAALVVSIYAVLSIWGEPLPRDVPVTRDEPLQATLAGFGAAPAAASDMSQETAATDVSEAEAVRLALAAGEAPAALPARTPQAPATVAAPEAPDWWFVSGTRVNLRAGPSTSYGIVGQAALNERAEVLSDPAEPWIRIRTEAGVEAYIYGRYLAESPA